MSRFPAIAAVVVAVQAAMQMPPALAQAPAVCAAKAVKAFGGQGLLEGAARSKARSAWMHKVRESRKLGPSYATWLRAQSPSYVCKRSGKSHVCEASAIPCKI